MDQPKVRVQVLTQIKESQKVKSTFLGDLEGVEDLYGLEDICPFTDSVATQFYWVSLWEVPGQWCELLRGLSKVRNRDFYNHCYVKLLNLKILPVKWFRAKKNAVVAYSGCSLRKLILWPYLSQGSATFEKNTQV